MKRTLLLTFIFLTACGPSQEEKEDIAAVACSIMSETRNMDGAVRVKEINTARARIGAGSYLDGDDVIQESLQWDLCEELVLDQNYEFLLVGRKDELKRQQEEYLRQKRDLYRQMISGIWFSRYNDYDQIAQFLITAEFNNEDFIFTTYEMGDKSDRKIFSYKIIGDGVVEISNANETHRLRIFKDPYDDQVLSFISDNPAVLLNSVDQLSFASNEDLGSTLKMQFKRPAKVTLDQLEGVWWAIPDLESQVKITIRDNFLTEENLATNFSNASFRIYKDTCPLLPIKDGFVLIKKCEDFTVHLFVDSLTENRLNLGLDLRETLPTLVKVSDDFNFDLPEDFVDESKN